MARPAPDVGFGRQLARAILTASVWLLAVLATVAGAWLFLRARHDGLWVALNALLQPR